jgi:hypothetical protein
MTNALRTLALGSLLAAATLATQACSTASSDDDTTTGGSAGTGTGGTAAGKGGSSGKSGSAGKTASGGSAGQGAAGDSGAPGVGGTSGSSGDGGDAASAGQPGASGETGTGGTAGTSDTGGTGGAGGTGGTGTGACNDFSYDDAPTVSPVAATELLAPDRTGGKVVDGTYFLTKYEVYNGIDPKPGTYQVVMVIAGSDLELAQLVSGSETRASFMLTTDGTKFAAVTTCPGPGQSLAYDSYSASDSELVLYDDEKVVTLTLQ